MNIVIIIALLVLVVAAAWYFNKPKTRVVAQPTVNAGSSAFARLAEADGKIVALRAATSNQLNEARAQHAALDEIHGLLG